MANEWLGLQAGLRNVLERRALQQLRMQQAIERDREARELREERLFQRGRQQKADVIAAEDRARRIAKEAQEEREKATQTGLRQRFAGLAGRPDVPYDELVRGALETEQFDVLPRLAALKPIAPARPQFIPGSQGQMLGPKGEAITIPGFRPEPQRPAPSEPLYPVQMPDGSIILTPRSQAAGQPAAPPTAARTEIARGEASLENIEEVGRLFKPEYVGPLVGRARSVGQKVPAVPVDPGFASFEAESKAFKNAIIKAITGAQMSEPEARRIMGQIPEVSDKPEVWKAKYEASKRNLATLNERIRAPYQRGGPAAGGPAAGRPSKGKYRVTVE